MKILALDTATEACSAALFIDGEIHDHYQLAPRIHTQLILPMVESLLKQAGIKLTQLDCLAFGRGPGSFTGVRIAAGVVQGLGFAADLPVVAISTLASIAQQVSDEHHQSHVLAGIDARMGGMYWGCYQRDETGLVQLLGKEQVSSPEAVNFTQVANWCGAGSAWHSYAEQLNSRAESRVKSAYADYYPHAASICRLAVAAFEQGQAVDASQALPVYLRDDVAKKSSQVIRMIALLGD